MLSMDVPLRLKNLAVMQYNVPVPWTGAAVTAQIVCSKLAFVGLFYEVDYLNQNTITKKQFQNF